MYYDKSKHLIFHHVDVITDIRRAHDLQATSSFIVHRIHKDRGDNNNKLIYSGYLKAIDPIGKSVILCSTDGISITGNLLVMGHSIADVQLSSVSPRGALTHVPPRTVEKIVESHTRVQLARHPFFHRPDGLGGVTEEQLQEIQTGIIAWFTKYMIPIELNRHTQELVVAESVRIRPPYEHESDYISPTRVALKRIKHIVDSRPK